MNSSGPRVFDIIYEERVAIMIYDGGLTESEALQAAKGKVETQPDPPAAKPAEQLSLPGVSHKTRALLDDYYKTHGGKHG